MNERRNLPSASSAERYALCPGSFLLEQTVPEPEQTEDARTGDRIHAALAGITVDPPLTDEEERVREACAIQEAALSDGGGGSRPPVTRETRLWFRDESFHKAWSGKPDALYLLGDWGLVIDYKTGRGDVTEATGNLQLRALAVLAAEEYWVTDVTVAIIQPLAGPVSTCRYDAEALSHARTEIDGIMRQAAAGGPRNPSEKACKYCRAKEVCPEARAVVETLPATAPRVGNEIAMTPEQVGQFLRAAIVAEKVIDAVRAKAKRMLEAGETIPGVSLKPDTVRESITKPEVVFGRFLALGGTQDQFMPAVKITKTDLKAAVREVTKEKGKVLDATLERVLEGCTEAKQAAGSLEVEP